MSEGPARWIQIPAEPGQFIASLFGMAGGIGLVIGFAISHHEPLLLLGAALIIVGHNLGILEERKCARKPL